MAIVIGRLPIQPKIRALIKATKLPIMLIIGITLHNWLDTRHVTKDVSKLSLLGQLGVSTLMNHAYHIFIIHGNGTFLIIA